MNRSIRLALVIGAFLFAVPWPAAAQWSPYPPRYPYPYPMAFDDLRGLVRIEVTPKDAEVYVDGYYAGIVDDFDGTFQRLRVNAGAHQIVVRRDGYHSLKEDVYLSVDVVHRIRRKLEPLATGESEDPRPTPVTPPDDGGQGQYGIPERTPGARRPPIQPMPPQAPREPREPRAAEPRAPEASHSGALIVRVQPGDADILIDGEPWRGPQGDERLVVQLPEGKHRVEVHKNGFADFATDVDVRGGETTPLNVSLSPQRH